MSEIAKTIDSIATAFEEYKSTNDARAHHIPEGAELRRHLPDRRVRFAQCPVQSTAELRGIKAESSVESGGHLSMRPCQFRHGLRFIRSRAFCMMLS